LSRHRGTYQSYINMVVGTGNALGAALGGFMAETLGWRWEFGVQVPFVLAVTVIAVVAIPPGIGLHHEPTWKSAWHALRDFDITGSGLLTVSLACLILGINIGGNNLPCKDSPHCQSFPVN
jgi:MFS family permease